MKQILKLIVVSFIFIFLVGCAAHIHKVGDGGKNVEFMEARQWYALWGLIPINDVNSAEMAGQAQDYTIKTETSAIDVIINIFTSYVSVTSRTVTVSK